MRKLLTAVAIGTALVAPLAVTTTAQADAWHLVQHFGHNPGGCEAKGKADVQKGWAGAYDCRRVGSVAWPDFDLWEA